MLQFFETFKMKKSLTSTLFTFKSNKNIKNGGFGSKMADYRQNGPYPMLSRASPFPVNIKTIK